MQPNQGTIEAVRGSVVDATFPEHIPSLFHVLRAGSGNDVVVEVLAHLDAHTVRGIALNSTRGLSRGSATVIDTHEPLKVPVGERVLGRMFDVFGETIDGLTPVEGGEWRSVHATPVPLGPAHHDLEIFVTGIKAIDVLAPLGEGRQERPVRRRGRRQNGADH